MKVLWKTKKLSTSQIILLSFMLTILIGSVLLMLQAAKATGEKASFLEALFTATSAVCVTGLVIRDTATFWSEFGQVIIMLLIQIGGIGVITLALSLAIISGKKIGIMHRQTMQEAIVL